MVMEAIETYNELLRLHQLNLELLETLELSLFWIQDFSKKNGISIPKRKQIARLLNKTHVLVTEISSQQTLDIQQFFTEKKSDKDFTEPK